MASCVVSKAVCLLALFAQLSGASLHSSSQHLRSAAGTAGGSQLMTQQQAETLIRNSLGEVIDVLNTMLHEFDTQADDDRANWEKYSQWSSDTETEKNNFIQEQQSLVMSTKATLSANREMVATLTEELAQLASEIAEEQKSLKELIEMRRDEHEQFQASLADVTKTINAVAKATMILQGHYGSSAAALTEIRARVQLALTMFGRRLGSATQQNVKELSSMLQTGLVAKASNPDFLKADSSKYENYEHQGGSRGVIGMLEDLTAQLEGQRNDLVATESNAQREFEATKASKEANLAHMHQVQEEKTAKKAECEATIKQCISTIDQAEKEISEAQAYVKQLLVDRAEFQKMFGERTAMRTQERAATQAALDALQSVSSGAKSTVEGKSPAALLQGQALLQVRTHTLASSRMALALKKLVDLGQELQDPILTQLATTARQDFMATQQQSHFDQGKFGPVLKLLNDLITSLEEEAATETSQHEWCENEKDSSVNAKETREKSVHQLMQTIEALTTNIATLKTEVEFLVSEIARVEEETRIAKEIRASEHEVYVSEKASHEEVIKAIQIALQALGGQYGFLQFGDEQQPGGPAPFAEYKSGGAGAASAQEMLQDLEGRYSQALAEIIATEKAAQEAHDELLIRNAQFIEDCTHTKNSKISERRGLINELADDKAEMKTTLIELHEVGKYLMDLRPSCDDIRSSFEERTKRREAEIAALKEALTVISDPTSGA